MKKIAKCTLCKKPSRHLITKSKQPTKIFPTKDYKNFSKKDLHIYFCKNCSYCFQYPIPSERQIDSFYQDEQSEYTSMINDPILGAEKEQEKVDFIINSMKKNLNTKKKLNIIEIGGFDGYVLREVAKKFKAKKYLIEPNKVGASIARKNNINVKNSYLDDKSIKNMQGQYNVVICKHVIEHVKYLDNFVENLQKLLTEDGILIIETPDLDAIFKKSLTREFILQHLHYFSVLTLKNIFKKLSLVNYSTTKQENSLIVAFTKKYKKEKKIHINLRKDSFLKNLNKKIALLNKFCKNNAKKKIWIYGASSSVNEIFTVFRVKKKFIQGIMDTDMKKIKNKLRIPIQQNLRILFFKNKEILKTSAIIVVASAKKQVLMTLKKYRFKGPRYLFQ